MTMNRRRGSEKAWHQPTEQAGFTLIEGMISAVILAVGLLALAGMQGISLGNDVDAHELARATNINADLMERIKFNRGRALAYNLIDTNNAATQPQGTEPMARGDYAQWRTVLINSGLDNAQGLVTVVRLDPDPAFNPVSLNRFAVQVRINWTSNGAGARSRTVMFSSVLAPE